VGRTVTAEQIRELQVGDRMKLPSGLIATYQGIADVYNVNIEIVNPEAGKPGWPKLEPRHILDDSELVEDPPAPS
jgi:hypothetical protein